MTSLSRSKDINLDGSNDGHFRYQMPPILVKLEGSGKMKKSVLVNIEEVCECVGRPTEYLLTYLGHKLSATTKIEKDVNRSFVQGHHDAKHVQQLVLNFVRETVMCRACQNPETTCHTEGKQKNKVMFLCCKGCGERSDLDPSDRIVKFMITHHSNDAAPETFGHATAAGNTSCDMFTTSTSTDKRECPQCSHKTSKTQCSNCGCNLAAIAETSSDLAAAPMTATEVERKHVQKKHECPECGHKTSKSLCSKCGTHIHDKGDKGVGSNDFLVTVKGWMVEFEDAHGDTSLDSFTPYLKAEGFAQVSALDQLGAVVQIVARKVGEPLLLKETKVQPLEVAKCAKASMINWSSLIDDLCACVSDDDAAADMVTDSVQKGIASMSPSDTVAEDMNQCVVVGILLALWEVHGVAAGLLAACKRLDCKSVAMNKFIDFMEESDDDASDDGVGSDEVEHA